MTAPVVEGGEKMDYITETKAADVASTDQEIQICDLYTVGYDAKKKIQPFVHQLNIDTGIGGPIQVWANIDDGALTNAMSTAKFNTIKHRLGYYKPSPRWLRMADGNIIKPKAVWEGRMEIGGVHIFGSFEVFESGGSWEFLLGKPLLTALHAVHEYKGDTIMVKNNGTLTTLENQINNMMEVHNETTDRRRTKDWKKRKDLKGSDERSLPSREVQPDQYNNGGQPTDIAHVETTESNNHQASKPKLPAEDSDTTGSTEIEVDTLKTNRDLYTRFTDPWKKERVEEVLKQVQIGPDLTEDEHNRVREFITEWADVFALSVSEVQQVDKAVHYLDIPPGTKFSTKVGQKSLTPPQRKYLYESIDTMLEADIIELGCEGHRREGVAGTSPIIFLSL